MKKGLTCLLAVFLLLNLTACSETTEASGQVQMQYRTLTYTSEYLSDGVVTSSERYEYSYNDQGQLTLSRYYENEEEISCTAWEYDASGNAVKKATESAEGTSTVEYEYLLNDRRDILTCETYTDGVLTFFETYTYREDGSLLSKTNLALDNGCTLGIQSDQYAYDDAGNLVQCIRWFGDAERRYVSEYTNGDLTKSTAYHADGTVSESTTYAYFYDDKGKPTKTVRYHDDGSIDGSAEYVWDETGLIQTELHYDADGNLLPNKIVTTYDEYGNPVMEERYRENGLYWRTTSTYEPIQNVQ